MINPALRDQRRNTACIHLGAELANIFRQKIIAPGVAQPHPLKGFKNLPTSRLTFRSNGVSRIFPLPVNARWNDAVRIHRDVWYSDLCRHAPVINRRNKNRIIIGRDATRVGGKLINQIVGIVLPLRR
jgi:hypothetical protein